MAARRVLPPERTFTAVLAIAPVAGIPPNRPEAIDARPCPNSSRSPLKDPVSEMDAATRAESRDSIAASAATVRAGPISEVTRDGEAVGNAGAGMMCGSAPIRASGMRARTTTVETTAMAMREPGTAR